MEAYYAESITINQSFWGEADTDTRFECGDQTLWNDIYGNLPANRRKQFNFNRIRRVVNMIDGYQRRNRKSTIVVPIENGDELTADQFTKIFMWLDQQEGVLETISESFHGALVTGMNLMQVWVDYRGDPVNGNIKVNNHSYNSALLDPYFRKRDLSDCNFIWTRSYNTKREVMALLPDKEEEILELEGNPNNNRDGKFQFMPEAYNYGLTNLLAYDEFYYRDYRKQKLLVDKNSGETMEWKGKDPELREFLQQYSQIQVIDQEIPTVRQAIVVQGKVMYSGQNVLGIDQYPFVPTFAYYNPQIPYYPWRCQGVVRGLRDAQYLYNRRLIISADILESQMTSGWIYKENALVNPNDVFLAGQGKGLAVKDEASLADVQQIQAPQIPPSMFQLSETFAREMQEISGVSEELLGSATDDKPGILSMLRQGAGLTTLQILFDQLDYSQKLLGKIILEVIQANFTPGKVGRIIGEEPSPQFYNKAFGKYDAAVEEGLNTTTQRQMQMAQMLQLREQGVPITPEDLLEASTMQNKKKIIENMQKAQQAQEQMQQQQMQAAMAEQQARTELTQARARADEGLGMERVSRIAENQELAEERKAEAVKDREQAVLNMVKAMKELESIDYAQVEKLIALTALVKNMEMNQGAQAQSPAPQPMNQAPATGPEIPGVS